MVMIRNWGEYLWPLGAYDEPAFDNNSTNKVYPVSTPTNAFETTERTAVLSIYAQSSETLFREPYIYIQWAQSFDPPLLTGRLYVTYLDENDNAELLGEAVNVNNGDTVIIDAAAFLDYGTAGAGTFFTSSSTTTSGDIVSVGKFQPVS